MKAERVARTSTSRSSNRVDVVERDVEPCTGVVGREARRDNPLGKARRDPSFQGVARRDLEHARAVDEEATAVVQIVGLEDGARSARQRETERDGEGRLVFSHEAQSLAAMMPRRGETTGRAAGRPRCAPRARAGRTTA